jgi:hypothetical protein
MVATKRGWQGGWWKMVRQSEVQGTEGCESIESHRIAHLSSFCTDAPVMHQSAVPINLTVQYNLVLYRTRTAVPYRAVGLDTHPTTYTPRPELFIRLLIRLFIRLLGLFMHE